MKDKKRPREQPREENGSPFIHVDNNVFDLTTITGRMCARLAAYSIMSERPDEAREILKRAGREG